MKTYTDYVRDVRNHVSDHAILQVHIDLTNSEPEKARYRQQQKRVWRRILYAKRKALALFPTSGYTEVDIVIRNVQ